jgi:hypothetical protein
MLTGRADIEVLASGAATLDRLDTEAVEFPNAEVLQVLCEIESGDIESLFPPALHPTLPGLVSWQLMHCPESPWGPFRLANTRIQCRSGVRPRAFVLSGRIDNEAARDALSSGWGYPLLMGEIEFRHGYDSVEAAVFEDDLSLLEIGLRNPEPLDAGDVQYVSDCHIAHTPRGIRLVQVDPIIEATRAERGAPEVHHFEALEWGEEGVVPNYPVSASIVSAHITVPQLRYLCLPNQLAFTGTEVL